VQSSLPLSNGSSHTNINNKSAWELYEKGARRISYFFGSGFADNC